MLFRSCAENENGPQMPESGRAVTAIVPKMGQMGRKWPEIAENGLKMAETGCILAVMVPKISQIGRKCSKIGINGLQNERHMAKHYR